MRHDEPLGGEPERRGREIELAPAGITADELPHQGASGLAPYLDDRGGGERKERPWSARVVHQWWDRRQRRAGLVRRHARVGDDGETVGFPAGDQELARERGDVAQRRREAQVGQDRLGEGVLRDRARRLGDQRGGGGCDGGQGHAVDRRPGEGGAGERGERENERKQGGHRAVVRRARDAVHSRPGVEAGIAGRAG